MIKYVKLDPNAPSLTKPKEGDAGYDLRSNEEVTLLPYEWYTIKTGIAVEPPPGYVGLVRGRSGLAFEYDVMPFHGTLDEVYRGEIKIKLKYDPTFEFEGNSTYTIKKGDKIAQVVFVQYLADDVEEVEQLSVTQRGSNGFGSTGK